MSIRGRVLLLQPGLSLEAATFAEMRLAGQPVPVLGVGVAVFHRYELPLDGNARWARATSSSAFAGKKDVRTYEWQS